MGVVSVVANELCKSAHQGWLYQKMVKLDLALQARPHAWQASCTHVLPGQCMLVPLHK
jgi:hypothetical protein